jgi:hypothetical protein
MLVCAPCGEVEATLPFLVEDWLALQSLRPVQSPRRCRGASTSDSRVLILQVPSRPIGIIPDGTPENVARTVWFSSCPWNETLPFGIV